MCRRWWPTVAKLAALAVSWLDDSYLLRNDPNDGALTKKWKSSLQVELYGDWTFGNANNNGAPVLTKQSSTKAATLYLQELLDWIWFKQNCRLIDISLSNRWSQQVINIASVWRNSYLTTFTAVTWESTLLKTQHNLLVNSKKKSNVSWG